MKKAISFEKQIACNSSIEEITSIAVDQDLNISEEYSITGTISVSGTYKMLKTSTSEHEFSYDIPVEVTIDNHYNLDNATISIDDFKYDILDDEFINVKVDLLLDGLAEKQEEDDTEVLDFIEEESDNRVSKEFVQEIEEDITEDNNDKVESLFTKFLDDEDTYSTYKVYIVREMDTIESIIEKYNITKEELEEYNDLDNIKMYDKIIIPYYDKD